MVFCYSHSSYINTIHVFPSFGGTEPQNILSVEGDVPRHAACCLGALPALPQLVEGGTMLCPRGELPFLIFLSALFNTAKEYKTDNQETKSGYQESSSQSPRCL